MRVASGRYLRLPHSTSSFSNYSHRTLYVQRLAERAVDYRYIVAG